MIRMSSFRSAIIFTTFLLVAVALKCYNGVVDRDKKVTNIDDCDVDYCLKVKFQGEQHPLVSYGCDQTNMCQKDGCYTGYADSLVCCCNRDYCNSSSSHSILFTLLPIALMKFFAW